MPLLFEDKQKSKSWYSDDLHFPAHLHRAVEIGVVEDGSCVLHVEGQTFCAQQGDIFVIFPNQIHSYESSASKTLICIITTPDMKAFDTVLDSYVPTDPILKKGQWEHTGLKTLLQLFATDVERETEAVLQGYYQTIFGKCLPLLPLSVPEKRDCDDLRLILTYINAHRTEEITRKRLSKAVGISESAVSNVFSDILKMSLPEYLNSIRIGDAAKLLRQTKYSVTQIAEMSGFGSIRSFNRAFLEHYHVSPSVYRNQKA